MTEKRAGKNGNFAQADVALAKIKNCTPQEVADWRERNNYTWHECNDMRICQKVPACINSKFGHLGGVAECKRIKNIKREDNFDAR